MKIITRTLAGKTEYIGKRGKPIKSKSSAMRFKTESYAKAYLDAMPPESERDGWIVTSEYGPSLSDGSYRY